ncbi:hypothetical protein GCM10020254_57590 [Streptomyces goshikiensis]
MYMTNATAERPLHSVSVAGIVIRDDGRVLVIRRADNGAWEPPGGILERDERPEEGVLREVAEETGIAVEVERLTGVYKNLTLGVIALVFRCRPIGGAEQLSDESTAVRWLTPRRGRAVNEGSLCRTRGRRLGWHGAARPVTRRGSTARGLTNGLRQRRVPMARDGHADTDRPPAGASGSGMAGHRWRVSARGG